MEQLSLLGIYLNGTVHILHLFISVPVGLYSNYRHLLLFIGDIPSKGLPSVTEIHLVSFAVRHIVCAIPRDDYRFHLEGFPPLSWQRITGDRLVK